jgi:hypothetical protein
LLVAKGSANPIVPILVRVRGLRISSKVWNVVEGGVVSPSSLHNPFQVQITNGLSPFCFYGRIT